MEKRMHLSGGQVFWLIMTMETGMCLLLSITGTIQKANQDGWMSILIAGAIVMLTTWLVLKLSLQFPNQTFIEYSQTILGKWLGKTILIIYFIKWYSLLGAILRQSTDFLHLMLFDRTPQWVIILLLVLVLIYVTYRRGVESIARCSEAIGPMIIVMILLTIILNWRNMDWGRLFPIYADSGALAIVKGSLPSMTFFSEAAMISMLLPFMSKPNEAMSRTMQGIAVATALLSISTIMVFLTLGNLATGMRYPFFTMVGFISLLEFIQNIDAFIVIIWFFCVFIKLALYLFIASYGTAQWLGIKNWRMMIWFVSSIGFIIAAAFQNVDQSSIDYPAMFRMPLDFPLTVIVIPLILWAVFLLRKSSIKKGGRSG